MKKQTAVEWLVNELKKSLPSVYNNEFDEEINQAKEMEKQQIIDAYDDGVIETKSRCEYENSQQYYNETFKNKQ